MVIKMVKILYQGDSITDGNRLKDEASRWDLNHQIGHTWAYPVTAYLGYKYPYSFSFVNRALSGNTVSELNDRWEKDALEINPDVIFILVGTNDCSRNVNGKKDPDCRDYAEGFERLYIRSREKNPDVRFIILEPFRFPESDEHKKYMEKIREIARSLAEKYGAVYIPLQEKFESVVRNGDEKYWIWDAVHPTEAGHGLIAAEVLKATEKMLADLI